MVNVTIDAKLKKVGNSLAFFIPAEVRDDLDLKSNDEVIAEIRKKKEKNKKEILSVFGIWRGKNIKWNRKEDRIDESRE